MLKRLLLAIALLLGAFPASATILAVAGEDVNSVFQGTVAVTTTSGRFDSAFARFALTLGNTGVTTIPPPNRIETSNFSSASADFWVSLQYWLNASTTGASIQWLGLTDSGTTRLGIEGTGTNQQIRVYKRDTTPTKTTLATATGSICAASNLCKLDCHIVYSASGSVDCYNNATLILTYSGDTTTNSATSLNGLWVGAGPVNNTNNFSEIIVSSSDTRSMRMLSCAPSSAGNTQSWTGSAGNINPNSYSDATFNYTTSNNSISEWKSGCTVPTSGTTSVVDVRSHGRLAIGASGPQNARFIFNESSTDYDNGADLAGLTTSFGNVQYDWGGTSPATSSVWTPTELNTIFTTGGFGVKSRP